MLVLPVKCLPCAVATSHSPLVGALLMANPMFLAPPLPVDGRHVVGERRSIGKLGGAKAALHIEEIQQASRAPFAGVFAEVARILGPRIALTRF